MTDCARSPVAVPLLPVSDMDTAVAFWTARGFVCSERQTRPTAYSLLRIWVALEEGKLLGWVGVRRHDGDSLGEIYILAVEPGEQLKGVARALIHHAEDTLRSAGLELVMVQTEGDAGHAPARACYENAGFETWPVARYFLPKAVNATSSCCSQMAKRCCANRKPHACRRPPQRARGFSCH